jgi:hypothetical protein
MESRRDKDVDSVAGLLRHLPELVEAQRGGRRDHGVRAAIENRRCLLLRLRGHAWHRKVGPRQQRPPWTTIPQAVSNRVTTEPGLQCLGTRDNRVLLVDQLLQREGVRHAQQNVTIDRHLVTLRESTQLAAVPVSG